MKQYQIDEYITKFQIENYIKEYNRNIKKEINHPQGRIVDVLVSTIAEDEKLEIDLVR